MLRAAKKGQSAYALIVELDKVDGKTDGLSEAENRERSRILPESTE